MNENDYEFERELGVVVESLEEEKRRWDNVSIISKTFFKRKKSGF